jgi:hypothetical protein
VAYELSRPQYDGTSSPTVLNEIDAGNKALADALDATKARREAADPGVNRVLDRIRESPRPPADMSPSVAAAVAETAPVTLPTPKRARITPNRQISTPSQASVNPGFSEFGGTRPRLRERSALVPGHTRAASGIRVLE